MHFSTIEKLKLFSIEKMKQTNYVVSALYTFVLLTVLKLRTWIIVVTINDKVVFLITQFFA